jgi:hypothetical protein
MELIYRGVTHNCNSDQPLSQASLLGRTPKLADELTYRGVPHQVAPITRSERVAVPIESHQLTFRGVNYSAGRGAQGEVTVSPQSAGSIQVRVEKASSDSLLSIGGKS